VYEHTRMGHCLSAGTLREIIDLINEKDSLL